MQVRIHYYFLFVFFVYNFFNVVSLHRKGTCNMCTMICYCGMMSHPPCISIRRKGTSTNCCNNVPRVPGVGSYTRSHSLAGSSTFPGVHERFYIIQNQTIQL